ncbi:MAG: VOC family protein [Myxococcales bacterium]|nr:VOC family protein [Myxococcales bacterium]
MESTLPPLVIGLRHVALTVGDLEACERFYVAVVGFTVEWRPDPDNVYLHLAGDNLALHRYEPPDDDGEDRDAFKSRRGQHLAHLGIVVPRPEDVDAWATHLASRGVPPHAAPRTHRDGARSFYADDPDGNAVQFIYHPPISDRTSTGS